MDLGFYFEIAERDKHIYNQTAINTLIEDKEKYKNGFFNNGVFLSDETEIETNGAFRGSVELAKFITKKLDQNDYHPSMVYTGDFYGCFGNLKTSKRIRFWKKS